MMAAAFLIKQRFSCFIQPTSGANPDDAATIKSAVSNRWFDGPAMRRAKKSRMG